MTNTHKLKPLINKVPEVTFGFWVIKVLSTTVGETGADYLAVEAGLGQAITSAMMALLLVTALSLQVREMRYTPWIYWLTVVLVSIVGTQITDILTDHFGISLYVSTAVFSTILALIFIVWFRTEHTLSIRDINSPRREAFYWSAVLASFALGTAAGDLATEELALGFQWGVFIFGGLILATSVAWRMGSNPVATFWIAYILSRPLGASLGDWLTQAKTYGGLGLGAMWTSVVFLSVIILLVGKAQSRVSNP